MPSAVILSPRSPIAAATVWRLTRNGKSNTVLAEFRELLRGQFFPLAAELKIVRKLRS
jgi:hypothetical protein